MTTATPPPGMLRAPAMRSSAREYFTLDLRGLRAALAARAVADVVTESEWVRSALVAKLGPDAIAAMAPLSNNASRAQRRSLAKLSIRLASLAAQRLDQNSRAAGMSRGAYLTRLIDRAAPVVASSDRAALAHALKHSAEELSVLSRDIHQLTDLLRRGSVEAARQYTRRLETLDADVRAHLDQNARVLAELSMARAKDRPSALAPATSQRKAS
jgi:hypothetical protein